MDRLLRQPRSLPTRLWGFCRRIVRAPEYRQSGRATDLNCLSVIQFAVDILKVRHIIVCGHYGCSGVQAALRGDRLGLSDNWLRHIQDVRQKASEVFGGRSGDSATPDRLAELNVIEQVANVRETTIARDAWERGQELAVHGWIYGLHDGLLRDLEITVTNPS